MRINFLDYQESVIISKQELPKLDEWKLDPVREEFELLTDLGVLKRYVSQMFSQKLDKKTVSFPDGFDRVSNETKIVIGRNELESIEQASSILQADELEKRNKEFVEKNFELLFYTPRADE